MKTDGATPTKNDSVIKPELSYLLYLKKIVLWIPYLITLAYLWLFVIWLRIKYSFNFEDTFLISSATIFYGALLCLSQTVRLKYWNK